MRNKLTIAIGCLLSASAAMAQTNTFPASGNVGIGTTSPASKLDVLPANGNAITIRPYGAAAGNTGQVQFRELAANGSNYVSLKAPDALASNYIFRLPINYGTNGQVLTTNGAGILNWTSISGGGANTTLSNLTSPTSVSQALIPNTTNTKDLGTNAKGWRNLYLTGSIFLDGFKYFDNPGTGNLAIGKAALALNANRFNLVAVGDSALYNNSTGASSTFEGNYNTALGSKALKNNSVGAWNTAGGFHALYKNTTGNENTAFGSEALESNTFGVGNTAIGHQTLQFTNGFYNVAVGKDALNSNTSGSDNIAIGKDALLNNTDRSGNVAIGTGALYDNGTGVSFFYEATDNVAVGFEVLTQNSTGFDNTGLGYFALHSNNTGFHNTAIGSYSINSNTSGFYNTAIGDNTMVQNTIGSQNTALGHSTMVSNISGTYNTCVGAYSNMVDGLTNSSVFGNNAFVSASNAIAIGNTSVNSIKGQVGFTTFSDARIKRNIQENVPGLEFITALRPVTYHYDIHKQNEMMNIADNGDWKGKYDIEKIAFTGFIAQEVAEAAKKINYEFSGVDKSEVLLGLRYAEFVVPLVKAVQELNEELKAQNQELKNQIAQIESVLSPEQQQRLDYNQITTATLEQNIPNPFNKNTIIKFSLPDNYLNAHLKIYSLQGIELKSYQLTQKGKGELVIEANTLSAGVYSYTLIVDNRAADVKQMIVTK